MTPAQYLAIRSPCLLAVETMLPKYASRRGSWSMVLTVNTGYEWIQAGYDGPVWHVSIARHGHNGKPIPLDRVEDLTPYRAKAVMALTGVGSAVHGEWWDKSPEGVAVHFRRRLSPEEQVDHDVYVRDIRGSVEHIERAYEVASRTGYPHHELLAFEMG